jgi:hypothetical protein
MTGIIQEQRKDVRGEEATYKREYSGADCCSVWRSRNYLRGARLEFTLWHCYSEAVHTCPIRALFPQSNCYRKSDYVCILLISLCFGCGRLALCSLQVNQSSRWLQANSFATGTSWESTCKEVDNDVLTCCLFGAPLIAFNLLLDRLYGLVVRVPHYRSRGPGSIPSATRFSE